MAQWNWLSEAPSAFKSIGHMEPHGLGAAAPTQPVELVFLVRWPVFPVHETKPVTWKWKYLKMSLGTVLPLSAPCLSWAWGSCFLPQPKELRGPLPMYQFQRDPNIVTKVFISLWEVEGWTRKGWWQRTKWLTASGHFTWGHLHSRKLQEHWKGFVSFYRTLPWRSFSEMDIPSFLSFTTVTGIRSSKGKALNILLWGNLSWMESRGTETAQLWSQENCSHLTASRI